MAAPVRAGDRHRADAGRVPGSAREQTLVKHQSAANEEADVEVQKIRRAFSGTKDQFGPAGSCRIVLDIDRHVTNHGKLCRDVAVPPCVQRTGRGLDMLNPVPKLKRHRNAQAADPAAHRPRKDRAERRQGILHETDDRFGGGVTVGLAAKAHRLTQKIDKNQVN